MFVLGHHYRRDEVIQFADVTGDSFKLARDAAARPDAEYIVRIDQPHLVHSLESLVRGDVVNRISVDPTVAAHACLALDRMLALRQPAAVPD